MVYKAISQASEYLKNAMIICRNNTGNRIDQLSFRIQLVEELFVKYANVVERKMPGQRSSDNTVPQLTDRQTFYKLAQLALIVQEENETTEMVCCLSGVQEKVRNCVPA
jgi:hypothetical protein